MVTLFSQTIPVLRAFYAKNSIGRGNLETQSRFRSFRYETRVTRATHFRYSGRARSATSEVARFELRIRVSCRSASREETHGEDHIPVLWLFRGNFHTHGRTFSFSFGILYAPFLENEKFPLPAYPDKEIAILFVASGVQCGEKGEYGIYSGSENYSNTCRRIFL